MDFDKLTGAQAIVHIFAILHAIVALSCIAIGVEDELLLTILTMTMALLVCLKKNLNVDLTASSIIVANIIGYILGNIGANLLSSIFVSQYLVHSLSTLITTEVLGWSIIIFSGLFNRSTSDSQQISSEYLRWIIVAMVSIFVLRLGFIYLFNSSGFSYALMIEAIGKVLSNSVAIIIILCLNFLFIRYSAKASKPLSKGVRFFITCLFVTLASVLEAVTVNIGFPPKLGKEFTDGFLQVLTASFILEVSIFCIVYMVNYAFKARRQMQEERSKANLAQYRYLILKKQVNPHFLFNSLNVLDCLVCEGQQEQASSFIHKLAGMYRYLIKSEDEDLVPLSDELEFVNQYIDLLSVRFPKGLQVNIDIPEECRSRFILPCSLQLLIENATKHNAVCPENPLIVDIVAEGEVIKVSNNIIPKVVSAPSTGVGQKYIRQQYLDLSGKEIKIDSNSLRYEVSLPLL